MTPCRRQFVTLALAILLAGSLRAQDANGQRAREALARAHELELLLPTAEDSGAVMYELGIQWLQAGDKDKALDWLQRLAALHQGYEPSGDPQWAALFDDVRFKNLIADLDASIPIVHRSERAFSISEKDLIPDGLGYDPGEDVFYLGSMAKRKIVKIRRDGSVSDFIRSGQDGMFRVGSGMRVDPRTRTLWVTSDEPESTGVFHYDLGTGRLIQRYVVSATGQSHLFNDLVVSRGGVVYVSDTWGGRVYRIASQTNRLEVFAPELKLAFANGLALSPDERALYVAHFNGGVTRIELATEKARVVSHPPNVTLAGIDGLYCVGSSLIAVQSGIGWPRVVRFQLNAAGDEVERVDVLESRNPLFFGWGATTGVVVGDTFYYVANTQIWRLVNDRIDKPQDLTPIQILKVKYR